MLTLLFLLLFSFGVFTYTMENKSGTSKSENQQNSFSGTYFDNNTDCDIELSWIGLKDYGYIRANKVVFVPKEDLDTPQQYTTCVYKKDRSIVSNGFRVIDVTPGDYHSFTFTEDGSLAMTKKESPKSLKGTLATRLVFKHIKKDEKRSLAL